MHSHANLDNLRGYTISPKQLLGQWVPNLRGTQQQASNFSPQTVIFASKYDNCP